MKHTLFYSSSSKIRHYFIAVMFLFSGFLSAQSSPFVLSWDKTGCQQNSTISEINFDNNISSASCLKVCTESTVIYRMTGESIDNVETIIWRVTGGEVDSADEFSTPIHWDNTGSGSITVVMTLTDETIIERTLCVIKTNSNLLFGWDKTGCQENKDNVSEIKFDQNFSNADCLVVCKGSSVVYKISGDNIANISSINWYVTGGYAFVTNELSALITWSNVANGSIRLVISFTNGITVDRTICAEKWESSVLLGWEKIDEELICEIKYDNSEDNSECILIKPNTTIPYTIAGKRAIDIQTIDWNVTGGYAYTPNQLSTLITWYREEEEKHLEVIITYTDGVLLERQINVANYNKGPVGGGPNAQNSIQFSYDIAGNQIKRAFIYLAPRISKPNNENETQRKPIQSEEYNDISYYPNPVKSELYIEWVNKIGQEVVSIELYDLNGRHIQTYGNMDTKNNTTISFDNYPEGVYALNLLYRDGEMKTLKIVKQ